MSTAPAASASGGALLISTLMLSRVDGASSGGVGLGHSRREIPGSRVYGYGDVDATTP
jgi:hypothetical protein